MQIASLKSKLAQKIFIFFISASFIPLMIGTAISYYQVSHIVESNAINGLRDSTKEYGSLLFSRLKLANDTLLNNADNFLGINNNNENRGINNVNSFFSSIAVYNPNNPNNPNKIIYGDVDPAIFSFFENNKKADKKIITIARAKNKHDIYFIFKNGLIGKLKSSYFWDGSTVNTEINFCVTDNNYTLLNCPNTMRATTINRLKNLFENKKSNERVIDKSEYNKLYTIWDLFLDYEFGVGNWKIITNQDTNIVSEKRFQFTSFYIPLVIFSLLLVILLSSVLIRRNLSTINQLIDGTKQIIKGNYNHTIVVNSDDELGQLADSFNLMSDNMGTVVKEYKAFSTIDQLILESVDKNEVVAAVLKNLKKIINFDSIILLNNNDNSLNLSSHYQINDKIEMLVSDTISQTTYKKLNLQSKEKINFYTKEELYSIPSELGFEHITHYFCVIAVEIGASEKSFIIGNLNDNELSELDKEKLNVFINRIELAFQALEREESLRYLANHDSLTKLPNKNKLLSFYENQQLNISQEDSYLALLFIDLDNFKQVNDNYGHTIGDKLLINFANLIKSCLNTNDIAARLGGDEFVVVIQSTNKNVLQNRIPKLCADIIAHATSPFLINNHILNIGTSIGVCINSISENNFDDVIRFADIAMYFSKKKGGNQFSLYAQDMSDELYKQSLLERDLRIALENEDFDVHYQLKVSSDTRELEGFEALFRWNNPTYGSISPFIAIEIAENIGLIGQLGRLVFKRSLEQFQDWLEKGYKIDSMAINVSPIQLLEPSFIDFVRDTIKSMPEIDFSMVEIEITEGVMLKNKQESIAALNSLRQLGVRIAIDDFGTGYSSLSYLLDIPANTLKIDRAFVIKIEQDPNALSLLKSLISLGKSMGYKIVAEGVETEQQATFLKECDTDELQGYLFSKPLPAEIIEKRFLKTPLTVNSNQ